jgi:WD40 repeat protein
LLLEIKTVYSSYLCKMSIHARFVALFIFIAVKGLAQQYNPITTFNDHESGITVLTRDPSFKYLIAGDQKGNLYFRDIATGKLVNKVNAHGAPIKQLQFNSNGKLLISATSDGEIKIFDFNKNKIVQSIFSPGYAGINFVLFSIADGFIYFNGNHVLFKTRSDLTQPVVPVITESDTITDAVITTDRNALIYACGTKVKVINTRTDFPSQEFNAGTSKVRHIALVKDSLLATWSDDGTLMFWHYNLGQVDINPVFFLKAGKPSEMNFSQDGKLLCTGEIGNWARVWEPMERNMKQELFSHTSTVTSSAFGLSKDILYTGSLDKTIIQWRYGQPPAKPEPVKLIIDTTPKIQPVVTKPKTDQQVIMNAENVPEYILGRKVITSLQVEVTKPNLSIYVYDNSYVDGDTMSLFFNGQWILDHYGVTKKKQLVELNFTPNTNNYVVLFANNMGKSPPNTAAIEFDDGKSMRFFKLSSDLKSCSAINFYYKK